jgi:hypothetical protein
MWSCCSSRFPCDAKAAANSAPEVESRAVLLITAEETEADHDGNYNHAYRRSPPDLVPGIVKLEGALLTRVGRATKKVRNDARNFNPAPCFGSASRWCMPTGSDPQQDDPSLVNLRPNQESHGRKARRRDYRVSFGDGREEMGARR